MIDFKTLKKELDLTDNLTLEDIRKIREYNDKRYKNMTLSEIAEESRKNCEPFLKKLNIKPENIV